MEGWMARRLDGWNGGK
jgi:hypothetical protein